MKTLKNHMDKNERTCQRTHVQNHAYANNSKHTYVRHVPELSNPAFLEKFQPVKY